MLCVCSWYMLYVYVCVCAHVYVYVTVCMHVCICDCVCLCICVCVCDCVCMHDCVQLHLSTLDAACCIQDFSVPGRAAVMRSWQRGRSLGAFCGKAVAKSPSFPTCSLRHSHKPTFDLFHFVLKCHRAPPLGRASAVLGRAVIRSTVFQQHHICP